MSLAPIVLFVYNRFEHTKKTIEALQNNLLAKESDLYIFSDGAKNETNKSQVDKVRSYIHQISGFKTINIYESEHNKGLTNSVIAGVSQVMDLHGKAIVVEDDIVTSKYFLTFMNDGLNIYENDDKVALISGYCPPMGKIKENFFLEQGSSWGWVHGRDKRSIEILSKLSGFYIQTKNSRFGRIGSFLFEHKINYKNLSKL